MTNREARHLVEQVQRHAADLDDVSAGVGLRQSTHHHVRVANRLHLPTDTRRRCTCTRHSTSTCAPLELYRPFTALPTKHLTHTHTHTHTHTVSLSHFLSARHAALFGHVAHVGESTRRTWLFDITVSTHHSAHFPVVRSVAAQGRHRIKSSAPVTATTHLEIYRSVEECYSPWSPS